MKKSHNTILILIALLFSCDNMETIIDLEIPPHQSLLVLNGRLDTDKEIRVLLSTLLNVDNNRPVMANANIIIFEDGVNIGDLEVDLNNYIAPYVNDESGTHGIQL